MRKFLLWGFFLVAGILTIALIVYFSFGDLTPKESAFLSILLTISSGLITWVISHLHTKSNQEKTIEAIKSSNQEELRRYARQAAQKVYNLSNQLSNLISILQEAPKNLDGGPATSLKVLKERMSSAVNQLEALKSFNDTSISDWKAVIPDELVELEEEREEQEESIKESIEKIDEFLGFSASSKLNYQENNELIQKQISELTSLKNELKKANLNIVTRPKPKKSLRVDIPLPCPVCDHELVIPFEHIRGGRIWTKVTKCNNCDTSLVPGYRGQIATLDVRQKIIEEIECCFCTAKQNVDLDNAIGGRTSSICNHCNEPLNIGRAISGIYVKPQKKGSQKIVTSELIEKVKDKLPQQPWPKEIHKTIAKKLGVSNSAVSKSIKILIEDGTFKNQKDGKVVEKNLTKH